jgi:hypothetical protein
MKKLALAFLLSASFAALGQAAPPPPPTPPRRPFMTQLKETVIVIKLECMSGQRPMSASGTGFFVNGDHVRVSSYLVTNRHVAECWDHTGKPMEVKSIAIRVNLLDGSSETDLLNATGNAPWILPADKSIDLAILPIRSDKNFDWVSFGPESFATDDMFARGEIHEGQNIIFSGFFPKIEGIQRTQPIVREGIISSLSEERLIPLNGVPARFYLGDVHVVAGNSGSPVVVALGGVQGSMIFAGESYRLIGVVNGYLTEDTDMSLRLETTIEATVSANSGITTIVPIKDLRDLLNDARVVNVSEAGVSKLMAAK